MRRVLARGVRVCLVLSEAARPLSTVAAPGSVLLTLQQRSRSSAASPAFGVVIFFILVVLRAAW